MPEAPGEESTESGVDKKHGDRRGSHPRSELESGPILTAFGNTVSRLGFHPGSCEATGAFLTRSRLALKLFKQGTSDCSVEHVPEAGKSAWRPVRRF